MVWFGMSLFLSDRPMAELRWIRCSFSPKLANSPGFAMVFFGWIYWDPKSVDRSIFKAPLFQYMASRWLAVLLYSKPVCWTALDCLRDVHPITTSDPLRTGCPGGSCWLLVGVVVWFLYADFSDFCTDVDPIRRYACPDRQEICKFPNNRWREVFAVTTCFDPFLVGIMTPNWPHNGSKINQGSATLSLGLWSLWKYSFCPLKQVCKTAHLQMIYLQNMVIVHSYVQLSRHWFIHHQEWFLEGLPPATMVRSGVSFSHLWRDARQLAKMLRQEGLAARGRVDEINLWRQNGWSSGIKTDELGGYTPSQTRIYMDLL